MSNAKMSNATFRSGSGILTVTADTKRWLQDVPVSGARKTQYTVGDWVSWFANPNTPGNLCYRPLQPSTVTPDGSLAWPPSSLTTPFITVSCIYHIRSCYTLCGSPHMLPSVVMLPRCTSGGAYVIKHG